VAITLEIAQAQESLAGLALDVARAEGASYADIRIARYRSRFVNAREAAVLGAQDDESRGFGVRVLCRGAWGFAASGDLTEASVAQAARDAVAMAKVNALLQSEPVTLAPVDRVNDTWVAPVEIDPFSVAPRDVADLLLAINAEALKVPGARFCQSFLWAANERKFFASTEGSTIAQEVTRVWPHFDVTAVSDDGSDFQTRASLVPPLGVGYEHCHAPSLLAEARLAGEQAVRKLKSPSVTPGTRDLILLPTNLWLTIHESIGHSTELDRALGFEANFAGTSFVTPDQLGKLQFGSPIVNVVGDRTEAKGLATVGYDDDGAKAMRFDIIKDGVFVGYQTVREQAALVGDPISHACAYADSYNTVPIQRMPNVCLLPGKEPLSPDDLIAGVEDGILIDGNGSWSIDQQRRNFQFSGQLFYEIKNGKVTGMLRDVGYQGITPVFWNSCDAICSAEYYQLCGTYNCGKAQPSQAAPVSHGCAPARFRGVNILNTRKGAA
jgi:TldD protein